MSLDPQALTAALWTRHTSQTALIAALGNGSASVIHADHLGTQPFPARPFLALRSAGIAGASREMRTCVWWWWIYDDIARGYRRINAIIPLIEAAYPLHATGAYWEIASIGAETIDEQLGLLVRSLQVAAYLRA